MIRHLVPVHAASQVMRCFTHRGGCALQARTRLLYLIIFNRVQDPVTETPASDIGVFLEVLA